MDAVVDAALVANGVYDVACAACMLWLPASRLGRLHVSVFSVFDKTAGEHAGAGAAHRLLAYWVLTYGLDRMVAGLWRSAGTDAIAALSYLVEGAVYFHEDAVHASVQSGKARLVALASLLLCACVAIRMASVP